MVFCLECGKKLPETAKFCNECGTKQEIKAKIRGEKAKKVVAKTSNKEIPTIIAEEVPDNNKLKATNDKKIEVSKKLTGKIDSKDTKYLKRFFTALTPVTPPEFPPAILGGIMIFAAFCFFIIGAEEECVECTDWDYWDDSCEGTCLEYGTPNADICYPIGILGLILGIGIMIGGNNSSKNHDDYLRNLNEWKKLSPDVLFKRLDQCQDIVAKSSFQALGISEEAKPNEGGIIRPAAYSYGPHLEFADRVSVLNEEGLGALFGGNGTMRIDDDGVGKGAGYYKICEDITNPGLYTREYDMMVVHFTVNQILVYKCVFDILEMTKRLEESYEWNYKHVVGINISGDDSEKQLGESISITGTKYMVISAASGDKIEIILGAQTNQIVDGQKKKSHLGGEDKIFEVANAAIANVRQAIRDKAN
tara:strand:+ start:408 stop:1667 length:1260 start_codon:yes stop_codon:yes gene_type:complete